MSGPTIRRGARPEEKFYILDKKISEDETLSWQARGLLVYLLGKPDNWQVNVTHLTKCTAKAKKKTGRDGVFAILDELLEAGYMQREQLRGDGGTFVGTQYIVNEIPVPVSERTVRANPVAAANDDAPNTGKPDTVEPNSGEPKAENPEAGKPDSGNPTLTNTDFSTRTESQQTTELSNADAAAALLKSELEALQKKWAPSVTKPDGLSDQVWRDFLKPRATQRKELTPTAMTAIENAATKAGMSTADAVSFAAERGWLAFRYEYWLSATGGGNINATVQRPQYGFGGGRNASGADSLDGFDDSAFG